MNIIQADAVEKARKEVEKKARNKEEVIVQGRGIEFNRKVLEMKKVNMLALNHRIGRDGLKQRDSGLNQVLCKIARDNKITLAFDFNELNVDGKKEKAKILGRMRQNFKLVKKFKNKIMLLNKPQDNLSIAALLRLLGADTKMAKDVSIS